MSEVVKLNPIEFGLDAEKVATIEQAFAPKIAERDGYVEMYNSLIKADITPEIEEQARDLGRKLVKVRTGIADVHKTQKAFFLSAGKFVDAWKNKETLPVTQMEDSLKEISNHSAIIEKLRIDNLELTRKDQVSKFSEVVPEGLGVMDSAVFSNYLTGLEIAHNTKIAAEKQAEADRIEAERVEKLNTERKFKTSRLYDFIENYDSIEWGKMSELDYSELVDIAIKKRGAKELEDQKIKDENDRLKKEADKKEAIRVAENSRIEKERQKERIATEKLRVENEARLQKERNESKAKQDKIERAARVEKEKLEQQIKDQKEKEQKEADEREAKEKQRIAAEKAAFAAPEKERLKAAIESMYFDVERINTPEGVAVDKLITEKFNGFKTWALAQINTL